MGDHGDATEPGPETVAEDNTAAPARDGEGSGTEPPSDRWDGVIGADGTLAVDRRVVRLRPDPAPADLRAVADAVLDHPDYTVGDWFSFPEPVFLVHDRQRTATFRLVVRSAILELHLLPRTSRDTVDAIQCRCEELTAADWCVEWPDGD